MSRGYRQKHRRLPEKAGENRRFCAAPVAGSAVEPDPDRKKIFFIFVVNSTGRGSTKVYTLMLWVWESEAVRGEIAPIRAVQRVQFARGGSVRRRQRAVSGQWFFYYL